MSFNNNNIFGGMTLKALLENPDLQHAPAALSGAPNGKGGKKLGGETIDFTSAFLGPNLWENKYEGSNFNLEYMDLDEFLSENGIPAVETPGLDELVGSTSPRAPVSPAVQASPSLGPHSPAIQPPQVVIPQMVVPPVPVDMTIGGGNFLLKPKVELLDPNSQDGRAKSPGQISNGSMTPPVSPLPVQVEFSLSESDLALSSIPGQNIFDPTAANFTEDELKPQPMIKKSKKVFVPEDLKDDKYWARRKKNNHAAKRSRDARRIKENQIAMRAAYLEKENSTLKAEMDKIRRENARLKHRLNKYEASAQSTTS